MFLFLIFMSWAFSILNNIKEVASAFRRVDIVFNQYFPNKFKGSRQTRKSKRNNGKLILMTTLHSHKIS